MAVRDRAADRGTGAEHEAGQQGGKAAPGGRSVGKDEEGVFVHRRVLEKDAKYGV